MIRHPSLEQLLLILPSTRAVLAAATGVFALGTLTLFALIAIVFFALIMVLSWLLNLTLSFVQTLGSHFAHIWTTGDDFTRMFLVLIVGYIAFRLVVPHMRTLLTRR